jgi:hypothetical protein
VLLRRQYRGDDAFGHAVDLRQDRAEGSNGAPQRRHRHWRRGVMDRTQRAAVEAIEFLAVEQPLHHDRREMRPRHPLVGDGPEDARRVEGGVQHNGRADDRIGQLLDAATDVEHRHDDQHHVRSPRAAGMRDAARRFDHRAMAEHDAFRAAGRAAGVDEIGDVLVVDRHRRTGRRRLRQQFLVIDRRRMRRVD